jgi:2-polyprenyl-6-hydroxyphenyl methylase/3-demethylubiquinone-9 3-methyltransferase
MGDETQLDSHFRFGENWATLLPQINPEKLASAVSDMKGFLGSLEGRDFLDIGCGSGLSSLAAYKLGAKRVTSIDIDPLNVENTKRLRKMFDVPESYPWSAAVASIVSANDVATLPESDVVCAWGVLHHTGAMWRAIENAASLVRPAGALYVMLYRDAVTAPVWKAVKRLYTRGPRPLKFLLRNGFAGVQILGMLAKHRNPGKVRRSIADYGKTSRGMSWYVDSTDWIGGYPFEYAEAETVIAFLAPFGFTLERIYPEITPKGFGLAGTGSYQYVFRKDSSRE